ncbi:hypothetical protein BS78_01G454500 [Paspalum vaginatum]|nr:hypothetical protein BS78_01G454500 [Paspalum vaginatum]
MDDDGYSEHTSVDELVRTSNASLVEATRSILQQQQSHRQHTIEHLSIAFYLMDESIDIVHAVDKTIANQKILTSSFTIIRPDEGLIMDYGVEVDYDAAAAMLAYGRRLMTFLGAYPRAFGGLTDLTLDGIGFDEPDMLHAVLSTCKKPECLTLENCHIGLRWSVLQIRHPELVELSITTCDFERVRLEWLPRLTYFSCRYWPASQDRYPLSIGHVPQLQTLVLVKEGTILDKSLKLSEFLGTASIVELDLDFQSERIWIQPESSKRLASVLRNLLVVKLSCIYEECGIAWTLFFLEAAPLLKELNIQVWDHTFCCYDYAYEVFDEEQEYMLRFETLRELYRKESGILKWEANGGFQHYNLTSLTIEGFQLEETFMAHIRHVMEAAVNLEAVSLLQSRECPRCMCRPNSAMYPRTAEKRGHVTKQISDWRSSPIRIDFGVSSV